MPYFQVQRAQKHLYPSLTSYVACVTSFFAFLLNILIMQRSISWSPLNKRLCKYNFERKENYRRNSINSRGVEYHQVVETGIFSCCRIQDWLLHIDLFQLCIFGTFCFNLLTNYEGWGLRYGPGLPMSISKGFLLSQ